MRSLLTAVAVVVLVCLAITGLACGSPEPAPAAPTGALKPTDPVPTVVGTAVVTDSPTAVPAVSPAAFPTVTVPAIHLVAVPSLTVPAATLPAVPGLMPTATPALASAREASPTMVTMTEEMTDSVASAMPASAGGPAPQGGGGYIPPEAGGSRNPNDAPWPLVYYRGYGVNPFVDADEDPRSTFGLDGDTASYRIAKHYLENGYLPEPDSVRVEEWVNSLPQGYAETASGLGLHLDAGPSPFGEPGYVLLRVGVSNPAPPAAREPVSVVFVMDVSGSMEADGRLELAKDVVDGIVGWMKPGDRAAVVTYADDVRVAHPFAGHAEADSLMETVAWLQPGGSTYAEAGLTRAYRLAAGEVDKGRRVSLVLLSDGVANVGHTGPESILRVVDEYARRQATLTAVGVGVTGNYNDVLMEALANRGNGTYHYLTHRGEVDRFLERDAGVVFSSTARDARIQVEFNPGAVRKYRLLGYENRAVADDDFRDDTLDFGEPGFARDVTALYELRLHGEIGPDEPLAEVRLRWRPPSADEHRESTASLAVGDITGDVSDTVAHFRQAAAAAEFAELLRRSYWAQCGDLGSVTALLNTASAELGQDPDYGELRRMVAAASETFVPYCQR